MKPRIPASEIVYTLTPEPEDIPLEGNVLASGDFITDRNAEEEVRRQLDNGNEWAWCCVTVTASWNGFSGSAHLGCCNYASAEDFKTGDYYEDLCNEAAGELADVVASAYERAKPAMRK